MAVALEDAPPRLARGCLHHRDRQLFSICEMNSAKLYMHDICSALERQNFHSSLEHTHCPQALVFVDCAGELFIQERGVAFQAN